MIKEARGTGATIIEAQENARMLLGVGADEDVQFEVIKTAKKKVLGLFGGNDAEVRAFIEIPDKKKPHDKKEKPQQKNRQNPEKQPKAQNEKPKEKKAEPKPQEELVINAVDEAKIDPESKTGKAIAYLRLILPSLGCENISIKAVDTDNGAIIIVDGENVGNIIGHRGETLDALQYLTSLAANNVGGYFKVTLNIGNYREKREQTLVSLANRISKQVIASGKSRSLEPMNPYERRIIHTAVQSIDGVVSSSYGEGANRRVVIYPEGSEMRPPRQNGGSSRRGGNRRGGQRGGNRKSASSVVSSTPLREPKKDTDIPLYGKIN